MYKGARELPGQEGLVSRMLRKGRNNVDCCRASSGVVTSALRSDAAWRYCSVLVYWWSIGSPCSLGVEIWSVIVTLVLLL